jgi:hypothetical protein
MLRGVSGHDPGCFKMFKTSGVNRDGKVIRGVPGLFGLVRAVSCSVRGGSGIIRRSSVLGPGSSWVIRGDSGRFGMFFSSRSAPINHG